MKHDEPDYLPGEALPGSGLLDPKYMLIGLYVWAVIILSTCAVLADTDEEGRVIVDGMGGGTVQWGYGRAEAYLSRGEPIRLEGRYTSAGTFLLWSVERLPGSCIDPDAIFGFHEPQRLISIVTGCAPFPMGTPERAVAMEEITRPYNEPLTRWFMRNIAGNQAECGFTNLRGSDMAAFGYPVCED